MSTTAPPVQTGLDALSAEGFSALRDRRLGLIVNHSAVDWRRRHVIELLAESGCKIGAFYSPEHGLQGRLDEPVQSGTYGDSGIPIHSLYGSHQKPTPEMLSGVEALVYDIADVGVRFYTYPTTMTHCLAAAAEAGIPMVVLDRPNPIRGDAMEGPVLDQPFSKLSAWHPFPLRHGLTNGEIALWANERYRIGADLTVVPCRGWRREMWFQNTGLPWVDPSPNLRNLRQAVLYPAIGTLEFCDLSVGRGTDTPFELFGAPWMDDIVLARELNAAGIAELSFVPVAFTPHTREFAGQECRGVYMNLGDWDRFQPVTAAVQIALVLKRLWPEQFDHHRLLHLLGSAPAVEAIGELKPAEEIVAGWQDELAGFAEERRPYLLY
jgi:uncharacterized protein YbbC (DUF1343 family)